jgi:hypothetical protein
VKPLRRARSAESAESWERRECSDDSEKGMPLLTKVLGDAVPVIVPLPSLLGIAVEVEESSVDIQKCDSSGIGRCFLVILLLL